MNTLTAKEIRVNTTLRKLIKEFMDSDKEEPREVLDYIVENRGAIKIIAPCAMTKEHMKKMEDMEDDEEALLDIDLRLIEDDQGLSWIPVFTSDEAYHAGDDKEDESDGDDDVTETTFPINLYEMMKQIRGSDDIEGIVIDPWTVSFPIPGEVIEDLLGDKDAAEAGISLIKGNIEDIRDDAIVNCSNNTLAPGKGGVNAAVFNKAGEGLVAECRSLKGCKTGEAKISDSYELPCKYIIHTVGPIYSGAPKDEDDLASCYDNSLYIAREHGLHSVAFPCVATGNFGYPKEDAMEIAVQTVFEWLSDNDDYPMDITFCCHTDEDFKMYQSYLNDELGDPDEEDAPED